MIAKHTVSTSAIGFTFASFRFWLKPKSRDCPPTRRAGVSRLARHRSSVLQVRDALNPIAHIDFSPVSLRRSHPAALYLVMHLRAAAWENLRLHFSNIPPLLRGEGRWGVVLHPWIYKLIGVTYVLPSFR